MKKNTVNLLLMALFAILCTLISHTTFGQVSCIPKYSAYGTYIGGYSLDDGWATAHDKLGNTYVVGHTASSSGIATSGAYQTKFGGTNDAFLAKYDCSGSIVWATYFGGSGDDKGTCVSIDDSGYIYGWYCR